MHCSTITSLSEAQAVNCTPTKTSIPEQLLLHLVEPCILSAPSWRRLITDSYVLSITAKFSFRIELCTLTTVNVATMYSLNTQAIVKFLLLVLWNTLVTLMEWTVPHENRHFRNILHVSHLIRGVYMLYIY